MANEFHPTSSKEFFVGREDNIDVFHEIWSGKRTEWIIYVLGIGGIGKTRLLQRFREQADGFGALSTRLIDFYHTTNQTQLGLLQEIASQLGFEHFPLFLKARQELQSFMEEEHESDERRMGERDVFGAFLKDYSDLLRKGQRILLLFDTCEEMRGVQEWFLNVFLDKLYQEEYRYACERSGDELIEFNSQTVIVMAGRPNSELEFRKEAWVVRDELSTLDRKAVRDYYQNDPEVNAMVDETSLKKLYDKTGGKPMYVALSFDWLKNDVGTVDELLASPEPFGAELVGWVRRLGPEKKLAILGMALAWRRMEMGLLRRLVGLNEKQAESLVAELGRFSFIKYRPADSHSTIHLHDEMRDLVNRYVWPKEQESKEEVSQFLSQIVDWYEIMVGDPAVLMGEKLPHDDRQRSLLAELLFYESRLQLNSALARYEALFRKGIYHLDLGYCKLLNQEIGRYENDLSREYQDDLHFRRALTAFRSEEYQLASELWRASLRLKDLKPTLRATILMMLVELQVYTGAPYVAIDYAKEAETLYTELILMEGDPKEQALLRDQLGQLYNNWGYACRVKGEFSQALEYYEKALKTRNRAELSDKHRARVLNNMGFIHFRLGNIVKARSYTGKALSIRNKLNIPYELGLSCNTMGMLMEDYGHIQDAVDLYHRAYNAFEKADSKRGRALALLNLGRIERVANDYEKAFKHLDEARDVFDHLNDKDHLINTYNELGCTYRQRKGPGELLMALEYLEKSLALSIELGKFFEQVDNQEDISIAYYQLALEAQNDSATYREYAEKAREYAEKVIDLIGKNETGYLIGYLTGKAQRTLGDLAYWEKEYADAFARYFEACLQVARVWDQGKRTSVFMQRQYEGMLDRMQERLHGLADTQQSLKYVKQLEKRLENLPTAQKKAMSKMKDYLKATKETAKLIG